MKLNDDLRVWLDEIKSLTPSTQSTPSPLAWEPLWSLHDRGVALRTSLSLEGIAALDSGTPVQDDTQIKALKELSNGEAKLRGLLISLSPEDLRQDVLSRRVHELTEAIALQDKTADQSSINEAIYLFLYVHELRFLKRVVAHALKMLGSFQVDLLQEIYSVGQTQWYLDAVRVSPVSSIFTELFTEGLLREVECLELEISRATEEPTLWSLLLWSSELQMTISTSPIDQKERLIDRASTAQESLSAKVMDFWKSLEGEAYAQHLEERTWSLFHHCSDLMSQIDYSELEACILKLEVISSLLKWYFHDISSVSIHKKSNPSLYTAYQKVSKQFQLVRAELQEKRLQNRLESIFGCRVVKRFEQLIFFLILLVLGLLIYELIWVSDDDVETRHTLALIDTSICFIFLVEFFTKLWLSDHRRFYFKRRWFVDLLPSIPFVFFTDYLFLEAIPADHLVTGRAARLAKLSRLARYVLIIRPFIRAIRLISFTLRGLDRFVRRYSQWLNQNLVFFEPQQEIRRRTQPNLYAECERIYGETLMQSRHVNARLSPKTLTILIPQYIVTLSAHLDMENAPLQRSLLDGPNERMSKRDIPVEKAIHALLNIQGAQLEAYLGVDFSRRLYFSLGIFNIPVIRSLPIFRQLLEHRRNSTPLDFAAWVVRSFGRILELMMTIGYWFADLYGIITGPKLIDRVGSTLVRSFERPAKRLLIIGAIFLIMQLFVSALGVPFFSPALGALQKFIGLPVIVIGSICLIPLIFGTWMKNLAGQATELYRLTSEAQLINLLKDLKEQSASKDLELIFRRVLFPEIYLESISKNRDFDAEAPLPQTVEINTKATEFADQMLPILHQPIDFIEGYAETTLQDRNHQEWVQRGQPNEEEPLIDLSDVKGSHLSAYPVASDHWWLEHKVFLLYRDYLDGTLLHQSDIKTTEQLLGNLSIRNLLHTKINLTKKEIKMLHRIDLGSHRSLFGPFMWFSLISQSISQSTAKLLLDYNRFVIPKDMVEHRPELAQRLYAQWKATKGVGAHNPELSLEERHPELPLYQNTDFSALHLLTVMRGHEEMIRSRFGDDMYEILLRDQRKLIRGIFSSYPLHELPKGARTFNPYQLYQEYLFGGRIFTLPFRLIGLFFKVIGLGLKWMKQKIDEIRFPDMKPPPIIAQKDFIVAQRKIDRMRKPIYMKVMELRARVDFAYLGLSFNGVFPPSDPLSRPLFETDLDFIQAIEVERHSFLERQTACRAELKALTRLLKQEGLFGDDLACYLSEQMPYLLGREEEVVRALSMAYLVDFKGIQSYFQTLEKMRELFDDSLNGQPNRAFRLHKQLLVSAGRSAQRFVKRGEDQERKGFQHFWDRLGYAARSQEGDEKLCWARYLNEGRDLRPLLCLFAEEGGVDFHSIFIEVMQYTHSWTDELVTLRTIQTLSILDIQNYRNYIWNIGDYEQDRPCDSDAQDSSSDSPS